ncbi:polysaccharide deacetylase family protein [Thermoactinospora rubra]|uniref:polysaccharide deacetylase family protein n=1 Tax=Thermoactinospora rubra TaxID=1088767 RepID=UPI001301B52C|nr:polysaccharide deacetylase family protein [Thermoactinospora rubra]
MIAHGLMALLLAASPLQAAAPAKIDCAKVKCLALTFDDGPGRQTAELLDTLAKAKVKATFFLVGKQVEQRPELARRALREGHELGNHTYSHLELTALADYQVSNELRAAQQAIEEATGAAPKIFRPPYGKTDDRILALAGEAGLAQVTWTDTTLDWSLRDTEKIKKTVLKLSGRDDVILMHDTVPQTVKAVPGLIKELRKRGFHLVTVSTLAGKGKLEPGQSYP